MGFGFFHSPRLATLEQSPPFPPDRQGNLYDRRRLCFLMIFQTAWGPHRRIYRKGHHSEQPAPRFRVVQMGRPFFTIASNAVHTLLPRRFPKDPGRSISGLTWKFVVGPLCEVRNGCFWPKRISQPPFSRMLMRTNVLIPISWM